jgi:predicted RNA-binding Zn-ribbon protein involved in translation (DUF1610 family)
MLCKTCDGDISVWLQSPIVSFACPYCDVVQYARSPRTAAPKDWCHYAWFEDPREPEGGGRWVPREGVYQHWRGELFELRGIECAAEGGLRVSAVSCETGKSWSWRLEEWEATVQGEWRGATPQFTYIAPIPRSIPRPYIVK